MPLRGVDATSGVVEWRCGACGIEGYRLASAHVMVARMPGVDEPSVSMACLDCGAIECFNTELTAEDEDATAPGNHAARAEQARLVRALCRVAGLAVRG